MSDIVLMTGEFDRETLLGEISGGEVVLLIAGVLLTLVLVGIFVFVLWRANREG